MTSRQISKSCNTARSRTQTLSPALSLSLSPHTAFPTEVSSSGPAYKNSSPATELNGHIFKVLLVCRFGAVSTALDFSVFKMERRAVGGQPFAFFSRLHLI